MRNKDCRGGSKFKLSLRGWSFRLFRLENDFINNYYYSYLWLIFIFYIYGKFLFLFHLKYISRIKKHPKILPTFIILTNNPTNNPAHYNQNHILLFIIYTQNHKLSKIYHLFYFFYFNALCFILFYFIYIFVE